MLEPEQFQKLLVPRRRRVTGAGLSQLPIGTVVQTVNRSYFKYVVEQVGIRAVESRTLYPYSCLDDRILWRILPPLPGPPS